MPQKYTFEQFQAEMKSTDPFLQKIDVFYPNDQYVSENIPTDSANSTIQLCVFYIEDSCVMPFVKYAVKINNGNIKFPEFSFDFSQYDSEDHLENVFIKTCDDQLTKIFKNNNQTGGEKPSKITSSFGNSYRGFIEQKANGIVYVFYDVTRLLLNNIGLNSDFKYAIADELWNVKSIFGNSIDDSISKLFKLENPIPLTAFLNPWFIKKSGKYKSITIPQVGYLCMTDDDGASFYSLTQDQINNASLTDFMIEPQDVGIYYFFSTTVLKPQPDAFYIRYAFFTMKLHDFSDARFPNTVAYKYEDDVNSVLFKIDSKTVIYGLKSPDQFVEY